VVSSLVQHNQWFSPRFNPSGFIEVRRRHKLTSTRLCIAYDSCGKTHYVFKLLDELTDNGL
jgi:hypothetical protein